MRPNKKGESENKIGRHIEVRWSEILPGALNKSSFRLLRNLGGGYPVGDGGDGVEAEEDDQEHRAPQHLRLNELNEFNEYNDFNEFNE